MCSLFFDTVVFFINKPKYLLSMIGQSQVKKAKIVKVKDDKAKGNVNAR